MAVGTLRGPGLGPCCEEWTVRMQVGIPVQAEPHHTCSWCRGAVCKQQATTHPGQHRPIHCVEGRGRKRPMRTWCHDVESHAEGLCAAAAFASPRGCAYTPSQSPWDQYALECLRVGEFARKTILHAHTCGEPG
eukprot:3223037-Amphidinium_carterae.3